MKKEDLDKATKFLDRIFELDVPRHLDAPPVDFQQKLDRLAELIDMVRFHHGFVGEDETPGVFTPNKLKVDEPIGKMVMTFDKYFPELRLADYRRPNELTLPLFGFLKQAAPAAEDILGIIREFIQKRRELFGLIDFQRTKTGVLRCETNVRFAARRLRLAGLIQSCPGAIYKHWQLSLLGVLVDAGQLDEEKARSDPDLLWKKQIMAAFVHLFREDLLVERLETLREQLLPPKDRDTGLPSDLIDEVGVIIREFCIILDHPSTIPAVRQSAARKALAKLEHRPEIKVLLAAFNEKRPPALIPD